MSKEKIQAKIVLGMTLTEKEKAYAIIYMGYDKKDLEEV